MTDSDIKKLVEWLERVLGEDFSDYYGGMHDGRTEAFEYEDQPIVVYFDGDAGIAIASLNPEDALSFSWNISLSSQYVTLWPENLYELWELMSMEVERLQKEKAAKRLTSITA